MEKGNFRTMNVYGLSLQIFSIFLEIVILVSSILFDSWEAAEHLSAIFVVALAVSFLAMIFDERRGGISYMIEFFLLFFIAIPAYYQISEKTFPWYAVLQPAFICMAFGILALSHISYEAGNLLGYKFKRSEKSIKSSIGFEEITFLTKSAFILAVIAILFAIIAGPSNLLVARFDRGPSGFDGLIQQFLFMCRSISLLSFVIFLYLIFNVNETKHRRQIILITIIYLPFFLIINYPPALPRFLLFGTLISISTVFLNYFNPKVKGLMALASIFILFVIFPSIKTLGSGELEAGEIEKRMDAGNVSNYLLRVDFDAFMQITSTVQYYVNDVGPIRYGENFLGVLLFFVPRAIWQTKPIDTGEIVSVGLGYEYTNVSSPLPAESLLGFGIIGPLLIFFLLARIVSNIESRTNVKNDNIANPYSFFIYAISMGFIVIILRGALNGVAPQFATAFLAFFVMYFIRKNNIVLKFRS